MNWEILVINPEEFVQKKMVLPLIEPYEHQATQRVRKVKIDNVWGRFAYLVYLIIHKIIAGHPRDLEDVRGILLKNPDIDKTYILHWLTQFEESLQQPFVTQFEKLWRKQKLNVI